MVCEIELEYGIWEAFLSARLPHTLDKELKAHKAETIFKAYKRLDPLELHRRILVIADDTPDFGNGVKIECAARYPISTWNQIENNFKFTVHAWALVCLNIARQEPLQLSSLMALSQKILDLPLSVAENKYM